MATDAKSPGKSHWSRWKRPLTMLFFLMLIVLFTMLAQRLEWNEVFDNLADFKVRTLIIASGLTLVSFLVYACFDLIGRTYIRQNLTWKQILPVGIISYAFNLNLSAWVGGIAMRYRLYSRLGVSKSNIAKILGLSLRPIGSATWSLPAPCSAAGWCACRRAGSSAAVRCKAWGSCCCY